MHNRLVIGILSSSLLLTPFTNTVALAESKVTFNKINNEQQFIFDKNYCNLKEEFKAKQDIIDRVNERFDKIEEQRIIDEQKRIEEENSYNIEFELTYYSRHPSENGGYNCTATGEPLREGIVANNFYKIGTKIQLEDGRILEVADRGGSQHFNSWTRLDVFVDTYDRQQVLKMGRTKIKGKILK